MRFVLGRMGFPYIRVVSDQVFFWYSRDMQGRQGKRETYHNPYQYPCKPPTKSVSLFAGELDDPVANTSFSVEAVVDHTVQGLQNGGYIHHPSKDGCGWLRHVTGPLNHRTIRMRGTATVLKNTQQQLARRASPRAQPECSPARSG